MGKLQDNNLDPLIDLMTERLTFERAGVKLYDKILDALEQADGRFRGMLPKMQQFRDEEKDHEEWLEEKIRALGGDAHGRTPKAELTEAESEGIGKVVLEEEHEVPELFHALLAAELVDNAGWTLLVELADQADDSEARREFEKRMREEEDHLMFVREAVSGFLRHEVLGQAEDLPS